MYLILRIGFHANEFYPCFKWHRTKEPIEEIDKLNKFGKPLIKSGQSQSRALKIFFSPRLRGLFVFHIGFQKFRHFNLFDQRIRIASLKHLYLIDRITESVLHLNHMIRKLRKWT